MHPTASEIEAHAWSTLGAITPMRPIFSLPRSQKFVA